MIDAALARKIDRFSRRAHAFHRFAHHPLCPAYRGEWVALGKLRLCRGCLLTGAGLVVGVGGGLALPLVPLAVNGALGLVLAAWLGTLGRWRPAKVLSRFLPAFLGAFLVIQGARSGGAGWVLALAVLALLAAFQRAYRRRGPHRGPCEGCPERPGPGICTGYRPIARREKAFRRVVGRWL